MAVGKRGGRSGGARTVPATEVASPKRTRKKGEGRHGPDTPDRPRIREAERERLAASPAPRQSAVTDTPTRQLRRQAAESGSLPHDSPVRLSPRPEPAPMPASPPVDAAPKGKKRRAAEQDPADTKRQRKKLRIETADRGGAEVGAASAAPQAAPAPSQATPTRKEIKVLRMLAGGGLKGMLRKEQTPSSEDLRRDPDETCEWREANLPSGPSFVFSRGAVPTTVLDSTTEEQAPRQKHNPAPERETEKA